VDEADRCVHAASLSEELGSAAWSATVMQMTNESGSGGRRQAPRSCLDLSDPPTAPRRANLYCAGCRACWGFEAVEAQQGPWDTFKDRLPCTADRPPRTHAGGSFAGPGRLQAPPWARWRRRGRRGRRQDAAPKTTADGSVECSVVAVRRLAAQRRRSPCHGEVGDQGEVA